MSGAGTPFQEPELKRPTSPFLASCKSSLPSERVDVQSGRATMLEGSKLHDEGEGGSWVVIVCLILGLLYCLY